MTKNATDYSAYSVGASQVIPYAQYGGNIFDKANKWLKKTGAVSKALNIAGDISGIKGLKTGAAVAKQVGYGKKKKH